MESSRLEQLLIGSFACGVLAEVSGSWGLHYNMILTAAGWWALALRSPKGAMLTILGLAAAVILDIIALAVWPLPAAAQVFLSFQYILKLGALYYYHRVFRAEMNGVYSWYIPSAPGVGGGKSEHFGGGSGVGEGGNDGGATPDSPAALTATTPVGQFDSYQSA